jgi:DNA polymerase-3 subunit gamma/tau
MTYIALYRKYRPDRFSDVVGQDHVKRTLINAVKKDQLSHAYLFSGPRGTGKTTVARILAKAANCVNLQDGEPCNECENCRGITTGVWGIVEIDGASHNSVDDIRELQDVIHHVPMRGRYTVYIIDEVHMLSKPAFNAFLKTLEEPPSHTRFILATTEPYKLPKTILSRCQHFAFTHLTLDQITEQVKKIATLENVKIEPDAAEYLALQGRGSMRDTISLLDQALIYCEHKIDLKSVKELTGATEESVVTDMVDAMLDMSSVRLIELIDSVISSGQDLQQISSLVITHLRNLMLIRTGVKSERILGYLGNQMPRLERQAVRVDELSIMQALEYLGEASNKLKFDIDQRLGFETAMLGAMSKLNQPGQTSETAGAKVRPKPSQVETPDAESQATLKMPQRPIPAAEPKVQKGAMVPDFVKEQTPQASTDDTGQKKTPDDDLSGFWSEFIHWLSIQDLPLTVLVKETEIRFEDPVLSIHYSENEEFRYFFALEDKVKARLSAMLKKYLDRDITVSLEKSPNGEDDSPSETFPELENEIHDSEKKSMLQMVEDNFLTLFPEGELKWD